MYIYRQLVVLAVLLKYLINPEKSDTSAQCYMIFWPRTFLEFLNYFGRAYVLQDVTLYLALLRIYGNVKLRSYKHCKTLGVNEDVYYSAVPFGRNGVNQGEHLYELIKALSANCYPSANEIRYWENKDYMHAQFDEHNIPSPKTVLIDATNDIDSLQIDYPVLTKILNGNHSRGILSHPNKSDLDKYLAISLKDNKAVLLQEQLDIRFDIRVVTIDGEVVYYYWRDKVISDHFTTTSTSNGSILRVDRLPDEVVSCATSSSKLLGLRMAAFDITYMQEGEEIRPYIFEVSPSFLLNPIPNEILQKEPYLIYKKKWIKFVNDRIMQFTEIKFKYVKKLQTS